jgi:hypothetical protein
MPPRTGVRGKGRDLVPQWKYVLLTSIPPSAKVGSPRRGQFQTSPSAVSLLMLERRTLQCPSLDVSEERVPYRHCNGYSTRRPW